MILWSLDFSWPLDVSLKLSSFFFYFLDHSTKFTGKVDLNCSRISWYRVRMWGVVLICSVPWSSGWDLCWGSCRSLWSNIYILLSARIKRNQYNKYQFICHFSPSRISEIFLCLFQTSRNIYEVWKISSVKNIKFYFGWSAESRA